MGRGQPRRAPAGRGLLIAGFALAGLALVLGILAAIPAVVLGILVIRRGRPGAGAAIITLAVLLPLLTFTLVSSVLDARAFRIPSEAMLPTLAVGERLITTGVADPERGDILVFKPPKGAVTNECGAPSRPGTACAMPTDGEAEANFIKRVVAVEGERLAVREGRAYVDGERQREPFIEPDADCAICNLPREITVPEDHVFVMGDNRGASADSREWGPIREESIIGEVRLRYWPVSRIGSP